MKEFNIIDNKEKYLFLGENENKFIIFNNKSEKGIKENIFLRNIEYNKEQEIEVILNGEKQIIVGEFCGFEKTIFSQEIIEAIFDFIDSIYKSLNSSLYDSVIQASAIFGVLRNYTFEDYAGAFAELMFLKQLLIKYKKLPFSIRKSKNFTFDITDKYVIDIKSTSKSTNEFWVSRNQALSDLEEKYFATTKLTLDTQGISIKELYLELLNLCSEKEKLQVCDLYDYLLIDRGVEKYRFKDDSKFKIYDSSFMSKLKELSDLDYLTDSKFKIIFPQSSLIEDWNEIFNK